MNEGSPEPYEDSLLLRWLSLLFDRGAMLVWHSVTFNRSIFSHSSDTSLWGQKSEQGCPDFPLSRQFLQLFRENSKVCGLGLPQGWMCLMLMIATQITWHQSFLRPPADGESTGRWAYIAHSVCDRLGSMGKDPAAIHSEHPNPRPSSMVRPRWCRFGWHNMSWFIPS